MNSRRLLALVALVVLVVAAALWLSHERQPQRDAQAARKLFPNLDTELQKLAEVRLVTAGDVSAITLKREGERWCVVERDCYPADVAKLSRLLFALRDLHLIEEKTANPHNYAVLGVEDPKDEKASGVRVDLLGMEQPVSLIVGKTAGGESGYVRIAGEARSLLAAPQVPLEREARNWLDRKLLDVPAERVQQVRISVPKSRAYTAVRERRDQADLAVADLPQGRALANPAAANPIAAALLGLNFDDVRPASPASSATETAPPPARSTAAGQSRAEYRLFDGTTITVTGHQEDDHHWIAVAVGFDATQYRRFAPDPAAKDAAKEKVPSDKAGSAPEAPPSEAEVRKIAETLASRVDGWHYQVPEYKFESIFQPLDELVKKP